MPASIVSILSATLRMATPLVFCAMAGVFSERSGTIDIGLEGKMLAAAFAAASRIWKNFLKNPVTGL